MKNLVDSDSVEGLDSLLGQVVTLFCGCYFYTGLLVGVSPTTAKLEDPSIVYETGPFSDSEWKDAQRLPHKYWYVQISSIESFGLMK